MEEPKKIPAEKVEVIGKQGEVVKEAASSSEHPGSQSPFGNIRVIHSGPLMFLLVPILLPLLLIIMFFMVIFALFFGKSVFKVFTRGIRRP